MNLIKKTFSIFCYFACVSSFAQTPQETNPLYIETMSVTNEVNDKGLFSSNFPGTETSLPFGIAKIIAGTQYIIAIDSATYFPSKALCSAYMAIDLPGSFDKIAFAAKNIGVNPKGVMASNNTRLVLVSDHIINISQNVRMILKNDGTNYVEWDCSGFKTINLKGYFEFSDKIIIPDPEAITPNGKVIASFEIHTQDIHNFVTQVNISPFCLKNMQDVSFTVIDATVDMSAIANAPGMIFPVGYQQSSSNLAMWQGFYLKQFTVKLPKELSKKDQGRTSFTAANMLIDNSGVSGIFGADNILALGNSDMSGWQFSISHIDVKILQNHLNGGSLAGNIKIPVFENNALVYSASMMENMNTNQMDYQFIASPQNNLQANVFSSSVDLYPSSKIVVTKTNSKFYPLADLTGQIKLSHTNAATGKLDFQHMVIISKAPYIQSCTFGFTSANAGENKLSGFGISINQIQLAVNNTNPHIHFQAGLNFMQDSTMGFAAKAGFKIGTKFISEPNVTDPKWQFDRIAVDNILLDVRTQAFELKGNILFRENNPLYGKGFEGSISIAFEKLNFAASANAIFGVKDDYKYYYVDAALSFPTPIQLGTTPISVYRMMGGMYYHMRQPAGIEKSLYTPTFNPGVSPVYIPDNTISYGFKAGMTVGVSGKEDAFNADALLEVQFNSSVNGGGLSLIKLTGDAFLMTSIDARKGKNYTQVPVGGNMLMYYDFNKSELHAALNVAFTTPGLSGVVNSVIHFDPQVWYVYIGKPSQRANIRVNNLGNSSPILSAYFMVGNQIEPMPALPYQIAQVFGNPDKRDEQAIQAAKGFAFGAVSTIGAYFETPWDFFKIYGSANIILGFDVTMTKYAATFVCPNTGSNPGFNGWYLKGQLYAYINAQIGAIGKFKSKEFDVHICSFTAALSVYSELIKPSYFQGKVYGEYEILSVIKSHFNFDYETGTKCGA